MPRTSVSRVIGAPREEIWSVLSDVPNAGRWNHAWTRIEITSSQRGGLGTSFRAETEDGHEFEFQITGWEAPEYIAFSPTRDESQRYILTLQSQEFVLHPLAEDETQVTLIATARAHGLRGRLIGFFLWSGHQKQGLNAALENLQALFETPEESVDEPGEGAAAED